MLTSKSSRVFEDVPGKDINLFYFSSDTVKKSKIDTYQSTNARYDFNSKSFGTTSIITISPQQALDKVWIQVKLPDDSAQTTGNLYDNLAVGAGWGWDLIENITVRCSGSADYNFSGSVLRAAALQAASNTGEANQLMTGFGGMAMTGRSWTGTGPTLIPSSFVGQNLYAWMPLSILGLSSASGIELTPPLPSHLMSGQITIAITLAPAANIFSANPSAAQGAAAPYTNNNLSQITMLDEALVQTRQLFMINSSDMLKLSGSSKYLSPITFYQNQITVPLSGSAANIQGWLDGQLRGCYLAFRKKSAVNKQCYVLPKDLIVQNQGVIIQRFPGIGSNLFMDTIYSDVPAYYELPMVQTITPTATNSGFTTSQVVPSVSAYFHVPFGSRLEQQGLTEYVLMNGINLVSTGLQLQWTGATFYDPAAPATPVAVGDVELIVLPYYTAALEFAAAGDVKYVF